MDGNLLSPGVYFEDSIPLRYHVVEQLAEGAHLARLHAQSEHVLRVLSMLEDAAPMSQEESDTESHDLTRLDFKLNLVLDLVGRLLSQHVALPPVRWIKMGLEEMVWEQEAALEIGSCLEVEVFLSRVYPFSVTLPTRIVHADVLTQGYRLTVRYERLSEIMRDALERVVFRHHRRSVAHSRRHSGSL